LYYSTSLAEDKACRLHALSLLATGSAESIVLADVYERVYNERQTKMMSEISNLIVEFQQQGVWSPEHLSDGADENDQYTATRHNTIVKLAH
jgi:hypothetical protein